MDVFPRPEGEFVQVWDAPPRTPGRRLLFTYLRTPASPREVGHGLYFSEGPYEQIVAWNVSRTDYYRSGGEPRNERILASGRLLVNDPRHGFLTRSVYSADFDRVVLIPKGKALGDRAIMRLQI